jgi:hypothetical protein
MATTTGQRGSVKRQDQDAGDEAGEVVRDQVEELARCGARQIFRPMATCFINCSTSLLSIGTRPSVR